MSRLGAQEVGEYFPTPLPIADATACLIAAPTGATIYDPCAGEGIAVARIAERAGLTAYGNELDAARATAAAGQLHTCTTGPYESVERDGLPFSVVFYNPPYRAGVTGTRLETRGLHHALAHLAQHGLFVAVVPLGTAIDEGFVARLNAECDIKGIARFPGESFERFSQVVMWAVRRPKGESPSERYPNVASRLKLYAAQWNKGTELDEFTPEFAARHAVDVPGRRGTVTLTNEVAEPETLLAAAAEQGATTLPGFTQLTQGQSRRAVGAFAPLLPLRRGHAAEMLAAGFIDGGEVQWEGKTFLVRGHSRRIVTERTEETGEYSCKVTRRERFATVVTLLDTVTGEVSVLDMEQNRERYEAFLLAQADALTTIVQQRFPAVYDPSRDDLRQLAPDMAQVLDAIRAPGALPGVGAKGLLPIQRDVATAAALSLRSGEKTALVIGETGTGKTLVGLSSWAAYEGRRLTDARPGKAPKAVVLCPAHLTPKWERETKKALGAFGVHAAIVRNVADVDRAMDDPRPAVLVISREIAKMGPEWRPVGVCTYTRELREVVKDEQKVTERVSVPVVRCPDCGGVVLEREKDEDTGELVNIGPYRWIEMDGRRVPTYGKQRLACECGAQLWQQVPFKSRRVGRHALPTRGERRLDTGFAYGGGRVALAPYISQQYAGRYVAMVDEVHSYKGSATDIGFSLMDLASGAVKVLALTGTVYGGKASTLFHLGYRLLKRFRDEFPHDGELAFVHAYGLMETIEYKSTTAAGHTSTYGYQRTQEPRKKEIAGAQPEMIALLLPHCAFMDLADMGVALPAYEELQVSAPVPESVTDTLAAIETFGDQAAAAAKKGDTAFLSSYLQLALGWPYRMEGAEEITHPRTGALGFSCDGRQVPEGGWALDQQLVRFCRAEKAKGRRVLLYVQQIQKRDVTGRLCRLLEAAGFTTAVLRRETCDSEEREAWVAAQVEAGVSVLLTNPALVETGLDLLSFPTIVHWGIDYSTYRLRQSSRRSWRLGQTQPVQVVWFFYQDTKPHAAMPLIAKKLKAAQHVDGRLAEGLAASVNDEDGDLMSALLRQVMTGVVSTGPAFPTLTVPSEDEVRALEGFPPLPEAEAPAPEVVAAVAPTGPAVASAPARAAWHSKTVTQSTFLDSLFVA